MKVNHLPHALLWANFGFLQAFSVTDFRTPLARLWAVRARGLATALVESLKVEPPKHWQARFPGKEPGDDDTIAQQRPMNKSDNFVSLFPV